MKRSPQESRAVPHSDIVSLAKTGRPHGVCGWIRLYPHEGFASLLNCPSWLVRFPGCDWKPAAQRRERRAGDTLLVKFEGVDDRSAAMQLVGSEIGLCRRNLPELARDEFYWHDLLGMRVVSARGIMLGTVQDIFSTRANDVLVVGGKTGEQTMIPFSGKHLLSIDEKSGVLVADWPDNQ